MCDRQCFKTHFLHLSAYQISTNYNNAQLNPFLYILHSSLKILTWNLLSHLWLIELSWNLAFYVVLCHFFSCAGFIQGHFPSLVWRGSTHSASRHVRAQGYLCQYLPIITWLLQSVIALHLLLLSAIVFMVAAVLKSLMTCLPLPQSHSIRLTMFTCMHIPSFHNNA